MSPDGTAGAREIWLAVLRVVVFIAIVVTAYYSLPFDRSATWGAVTLLVVGLILLIGLIALQVRLIIRSSFPRVRAVEALAGTIPLFLFCSPAPTS
jgi:voltage-gated potassium channel